MSWGAKRQRFVLPLNNNVFACERCGQPVGWVLSKRKKGKVYLADIIDLGGTPVAVASSFHDCPNKGKQ